MKYIKYHINKGWDYQWTEIPPNEDNSLSPLLLKTGCIFNKQDENGEIDKEIINLLVLKVNNPIKDVSLNNGQYIASILGDIKFSLYNNEQNKNKNIYLYIWNELPLEIKNFQSNITESIFTNGKKYQISPSFTSLGANEITISNQELPLKKSDYLYIAIYYEENPDIKIDISSFNISIEEKTISWINYKVNYMYNDNIIFFKDYSYKNNLDDIIIDEIKEEINSNLYDITLEQNYYKETKINDGEYQRIYFPKITPKEDAISILFNNEKISTKIGARHIFYPSRDIEEFDYWEINDELKNYNYILDLIVEEKCLIPNSNEIKISPYYKEAIEENNIITLNIRPSTGDNSTIELKIPIAVNKENKFYFPANYKNKAIQYYQIGEKNFYSPYIEYSKNDFSDEYYIDEIYIKFLEKDGDPWQWPYFQKLEENNLKPIDLRRKEELNNGGGN